MNILILVNIAIIFILSVTDILKATTQIRLSTGNNISVFDHLSRRMLQNRRFNNLLRASLDLSKKPQKPLNKKPENTNRPKDVGRPKQKPLDDKRENTNRPKDVGRPKQKPLDDKRENTNRPKRIGRPKQKPLDDKRENTNRPKRIGRPKQKPPNEKRENTNRPKRIGRPKPKRIIRGQLADIAKFPYMASVVMLSPVAVIASAIIVSQKWAVTHITPGEIYDLNEHFSDNVRILYQNAKNANQWIHKINDIVDIFTLHTGRLVVMEVDRPFHIKFYQIAHFALDFNYAINSRVKVVGWQLWDKTGVHQFDVESLRYADTKLVPCDFKIFHQNTKHMFICTLGGIACWGDESAALVRDGLIAGILVQKEKTCGYLANKTTDMYLKSNFLIEFITKYIHTDVKYD